MFRSFVVQIYFSIILLCTTGLWFSSCSPLSFSLYPSLSLHLDFFYSYVESFMYYVLQKQGREKRRKIRIIGYIFFSDLSFCCHSLCKTFTESIWLDLCFQFSNKINLTCLLMLKSWNIISTTLNIKFEGKTRLTKKIGLAQRVKKTGCKIFLVSSIQVLDAATIFFRICQIVSKYFYATAPPHQWTTNHLLFISLFLIPAFGYCSHESSNDLNIIYSLFGCRR